MKKLFKVICVILAIVSIPSMSVCADESGTYASAFFASYDSSIRHPSGNAIQIWFDVVGNGGMDEIGVSSIELERSSDGNSWSSVKIYLPEDYPQMICEDTSIAYNYVPYYGTYGYYYRAFVTFYAKNSRGVGYMYEYSETLYLRAS